MDLAKNVFQVRGVDAEGTGVITRQLRRTQMIEFFSKLPPCLIEPLDKKPRKLAAVALANKMARIVWVLLVKGGTYLAPSLAATA